MFGGADSEPDELPSDVVDSSDEEDSTELDDDEDWDTDLSLLPWAAFLSRIRELWRVLLLTEKSILYLL